MLAALSLPASTAALEANGDVQSKLSLPPAGAKHLKLDSALAQVAGKDELRGRSIEVEAVARVARRAELEAAIRAAGGTTSGRYARLIEARLPVRALETLANHPAAMRLRSPARPQPQVVAGQGIVSTGAAAWHSAQTAGAGVDIAIVDLGFRGWTTRQAEGELPTQVATADFCGGGLFDGPAAEDHGTAVAEVVHEVAPAAKLHLVCIDTPTSLGEAKDYVVANDIAIVNHSVAWLNTSRGDGTGATGTPDAIVADARAQGVLWVNAAGNYGQEHWTGAFSDPDGDELHNFAGADLGNDVFLFDDGCVFLKWDDWPGSDQDFDLHLIRSADDEIIDQSLSPQSGSQEPSEIVCTPDAGAYYVAISRFAGSAAPRFDLIVTNGEDLEHNDPAGSVVEPASSPHAVAAGAVCWQSGALEDYSSRGPTIDGRTKPDLAGPDAVSTVTYQNTSDCSAGFAGTSSSAAHVAGAAALLKQANPGLGPAELQTALEAKVFDLGAPGRDNDSGAGRLTLGSAPPAPPSAPANAGLPLISGLPHQGQSLTASDGAWTNGAAFFAFRWLRCDAGGSACAPIAGARGRTYTPTASDVGLRVRVRVTAANTGGSTQAVSAATPQIQPPVQPPANTVAPSSAGVAQYGQVASASLGAWSGTSPFSFQLEWLRCNSSGDACVVIAGAVSATYQYGLEDIGMTVRVRVVATNPAGSATSTSAASPLVSPTAPALVSPPTIAGNAIQGQTLTSTPGTWTFAATLSLQWRRCAADGTGCTAIPGATAATYTLSRADVGFRLDLLVLAANVAGTNGATTGQSAVVAAGPGIGPPPNVDPPAERRVRLVVVGFSVRPRVPQAGRTLALVLRFGTRATSTRGATRRLRCSAKVGRVALRPAVKSIRGGAARCAWAIPKTAAGKRLRAAIVVSEGPRSVRRTVSTTVRGARLR